MEKKELAAVIDNSSALLGDSVAALHELSEAPIHKKKRETVVLEKGMTLRLLAKDLFGNKEFWVYIYLENRDQIHNPNKVTEGIELLVPDRMKYSINAADTQSVEKAKLLGNEIFNSLNTN